MTICERGMSWWLSSDVRVKRVGSQLNICYFIAKLLVIYWVTILTLFGVEWVIPRIVPELLTSWGALFGYGPAKEVWRLVSMCLMWCIWRERNARQFEDVKTSMMELRKHLLNTLYIWIASHHSLNVFTYADFLNLFYVRSY
jgi:hypothetical protein